MQGRCGVIGCAPIVVSKSHGMNRCLFLRQMRLPSKTMPHHAHHSSPCPSLASRTRRPTSHALFRFAARHPEKKFVQVCESFMGRWRRDPG